LYQRLKKYCKFALAGISTKIIATDAKQKKSQQSNYQIIEILTL